MGELKEMLGKRVEITTRKDGKIYIHSGILTDIIDEYIHLESDDGSGVWIAKKLIISIKEAKR